MTKRRLYVGLLVWFLVIAVGYVAVRVFAGRDWAQLTFGAVGVLVGVALAADLLRPLRERWIAEHGERGAEVAANMRFVRWWGGPLIALGGLFNLPVGLDRVVGS